MNMVRWYRVLSVVSWLILFVTVKPTEAGPIALRTAPAGYHILARTRLALKNYNLRSQGCNVGVNNSGGRLGAGGPVFADNTQLVSDIVDGLGRGGDLFQIFSNEGSLDGVTVRHPGPATNPRFPGEGFRPPILAAETDQAFIAACDKLPGGAFPTSFSAGTIEVTTKKGGGDCTFKCPGSGCGSVADSEPDNDICDLPAGKYGVINVKNDSKISFDGGSYDIAEFQNGKGVLMLVKAPTTLNVGEGAELRFGDSAVVAVECGELRMNYLGGKSVERSVSLGKHSRITMDLCAPYALLRLGRDNVLEGHFFAGEVAADENNQGFCCAGCACFDSFWPLEAGEGETIKLSGGCDFRNITRVIICGADAEIVSRGSEELTAVVPPVGAPKSCKVEIESAAGLFSASEMLRVTGDD